jgi:hypothetical protein
MKQRTGYGNKAYARRPIDAQQISGWLLFLMVISAGAFLFIALTRSNGFFPKKWGILLAFTLTEAVVEAAKRFLINMVSEA